ncbi:37351_t:CDS:2, partial [Gigaspora margarita]
MTSLFPKGDFYIKSAASPYNLVIDVKDRTEAIVTQQNTDDARYQLWNYTNNLIINQSLNLCLETESENINAGSRLHLKINNQNNQRWIFSNDGHIALQNNPRFVIEVKGAKVRDGSYVVLSDTGSETYKSGLYSQFNVVPNKTNAAIGVIRLELICAKDLKDVDSLLASGKSDPYVRVFHSGNNKNIIAQTKVIDNDLNPVWNEVHFLPLRNIGEKFILDVMDFNTIINDEPLGNCTLDITGELVKEVSEGCYEGTSNGIDVWAKLTIQGQIHYKAKFFPLEPLQKPTPDFLTNLKEKPFGRAAFYVLITLQAPNGGFPPSDTLANLFGFEFQKQLLELYKKQCRNDHILKINPAVWTTSMILWFLRYLLKDYRSEWGGIYERAEQFISKEINDFEIEDIVIATGSKAIRERFDIGEPDSKNKRITRETITITRVRRILKCQHNSGPYPFTNDLANSFGYE